MCTAIRYGNFFCRNLDYDICYNEKILFMPKHFSLRLRNGKSIREHYTVLGTGIESEGFPLFFDAFNEKGLCAAGLNFPKDAYYRDARSGMENIASFEFIPYILSRCDSVESAKEIIKRINVTNTPFSAQYPPSPLHWIFADKEKSVVVECTKNGFRLHRNPTDVLTNSPAFDIQLFNLKNYRFVSAAEGENRFSKRLTLTPYSLGMGGIGLPGDFSSASRFVRACFLLHNSPDLKEKEGLMHGFRLLNSVAMPKGAVITEADEYEYTQYSAVTDTKNLSYSYCTYGDINIKTLFLRDFEKEGTRLISLEK